MMIYAGIDEAGYGPMFGPLVVAQTVIGLRADPSQPHPVDNPDTMWDRLTQAVSRTLSDRKGRIAVNDSKKLRTAAAGIKYLELGALGFAALAGKSPATVDQWLDCIGETAHHDLSSTPWYDPTDNRPWSPLPTTLTPGELAVARGLLSNTAKQQGVEMLDLGGSVVFENRFNQMIAATRSKASLSFTFVAGHLRKIWDRFGSQHPIVVVDRQSGRTRYRELLSMNFPEATLAILDETPQQSAYCLQDHPHRGMTVRFEVNADSRHMPTALASMIAKYTRELMMTRFNKWFAHHAPNIKPTAGYASDAKRFWREIQPMLPQLAIAPDQLRRLK